MRRVLVFVIALTALVTAGVVRATSPAPALVRLSVELPDNPTVGARLFAEKQCVKCHALGGGQPGIGPDLGRIHFTGTVLDVAGAFWNHAPVMREKMRDLKIQAPTLTSGEMADIVAFVTAYRYYLTELGEPGNPALGQEVFKTKQCIRCHSAAGSDWGKPGPSLERYRGQFSAISMAQVMWNHGPQMAQIMHERGVPWPNFSGREMGDLLAYLQAGNEGIVTERVYFEPGSPRRGRDLFQTKRCIACHAIAGEGGHIGPDLGTRGRELVGSISSIAGLMWNHSQVMTAELARRAIPRATFSGQEMADIIAYLYFVNYATVYGSPDRGQRIFAGKCAPCHSLGAGKRIGPDLTTVSGIDDPVAVITAMWNHAQQMGDEVRRRGLVWPQFSQGETADLTAYLLSKRPPGPPVAKR
jgi:cytochrome c2